MKDGVILRVSEPARMGIDDSGLNAVMTIGRCTPKIIVLVNAVGQYTADFSEVTERIDGRETIASR